MLKKDQAIKELVEKDTKKKSEFGEGSLTLKKRTR